MIVPDVLGVIVAEVILPLLQLMSTILPPRAQTPFMLPPVHASGRAGNREMVAVELLIS